MAYVLACPERLTTEMVQQIADGEDKVTLEQRNPDSGTSLTKPLIELL